MKEFVHLQADHVRVNWVAPHDIFIVFSIPKDNIWVVKLFSTYSVLGLYNESMRYYHDDWL